MNRATFRIMMIAALTATGLIMASAAQANPETTIAGMAKRFPGGDLKGQSQNSSASRSHRPHAYLTPDDIPDYYLPFNTTRTSRLIKGFIKRRGDQITSGSISIWHTPTGIFVGGY